MDARKSIKLLFVASLVSSLFFVSVCVALNIEMVIAFFASELSLYVFLGVSLLVLGMSCFGVYVDYEAQHGCAYLIDKDTDCPVGHQYKTSNICKGCKKKKYWRF